MLAGAVAAVDHGQVGRAREFGDRALFRMADHERVDVAGHHAARIVDRFTLGHRREGEARRVAHRAAEPAERGAERHARARARLEEQVAEHRALEHARDLAAARDRLHHVGDPEQRFDGIARELVDRQQLRPAFEQELLRKRLSRIYALRISVGGRRALDDFGDETLDDLGHAARFLRIVRQQPCVEGAPAHADAVRERFAGHVQAAHRVAQERLLRNGHRSAGLSEIYAMRMVGRRQPKSSGKCARIDEGGIGKRCATPPRASETRLTIALHRAMRRVRIIGTRPRAPARADFDFDTPAAREASALT